MTTIPTSRKSAEERREEILEAALIEFAEKGLYGTSTDDIARFRERLKSCSVLPESVGPGDKVTIRLRANFLPDGRLASPPIVLSSWLSFGVN